MICFVFIFDWSKKDAARDSPNSNNIMFRIKVSGIIILITKHEYSRCSNKLSANTISNVWRPERRIWSLRLGLRPLWPVNPFEYLKIKYVHVHSPYWCQYSSHIAIPQWICTQFPQGTHALKVIRFSIPILYMLPCSYTEFLRFEILITIPIINVEQ